MRMFRGKTKDRVNPNYMPPRFLEEGESYNVPPMIDGEWVYGSLSMGGGSSYDPSRTFIEPNVPVLERIEVIPETVGQSIGRKDVVNGKEVYGGDIVRFLNHPYLAEVKYCPEFAAFLFDSHNDKTRNNPNAQMLWRDAFEIIGNIHEHPKLL